MNMTSYKDTGITGSFAPSCRTESSILIKAQISTLLNYKALKKDPLQYPPLSRQLFHSSQLLG